MSKQDDDHHQQTAFSIVAHSLALTKVATSKDGQQLTSIIQILTSPIDQSLELGIDVLSLNVIDAESHCDPGSMDEVGRSIYHIHQ